MAESDNPDVEVIVPPNNLKSKVSTVGPGVVTLQTLERAEQAIVNMTDNYLQWVEDDLAKLQAALNDLKNDKANWATHKNRLFQVSHDIKGQGGSFGYHLMTVMGNSLCRFLERSETLSQSGIEVIELHVAAMKLVIAQRVQGDGGREGERLLKGLELVIAKVAG